MAWNHPWLAVFLGLAWVVFFASFTRAQRRAVGWLEEWTAERFRIQLSRWRLGTMVLPLGLLFLGGGLLAVAAGGPGLEGEATETATGPRLVFLLDASASMAANDTVGGDASDAPAPSVPEMPSRFDRARVIATTLLGSVADAEAAVVTFSGIATYQAPMIGDREILRDTLRWAEMHNVFRQTGSDFAAALDAALHLASVSPGVQVVLLSDGELPTVSGPEASAVNVAAFEEPLAALGASGVPVHTVALGSEGGQTRIIWDLREEPENGQRTPLLEFTTRRETRHLRRMSEATGGIFAVDEPGVAGRLAVAVRQRQELGKVGRRLVADPRAGRDLAPLLAGLFVLLFVAETLWWDRPRSRGPTFDLAHLGEPAGSVRRGGRPTAVRDRSTRVALLAWVGAFGLGVALVVGCGPGRVGTDPAGGDDETAFEDAASPSEETASVEGQKADSQPEAEAETTALARAHGANEAGIESDQRGDHELARGHYRRSEAYGARPAVPAHNWARSHALEENWSSAHDGYQRPLSLDPGLFAAQFDDGVVLWRWGRDERDPEGCQLERTRDLWRAASRRFRRVAASDDPQAPAAGRNLAALLSALAEVDALIADPPAACGGSGGDGGDDGEPGGGAVEPDSEETEEGGDGSNGGGSEDGDPEDGDAGDDDPEEQDEASDDEGTEGGEEGTEEGESSGEDGKDGEEGGEAGGEAGGDSDSGGDDGEDGEGSGGGAGSAGRGGGTGEAPPDAAELAAARVRMDEARDSQGRFFRRSGPEQFPSDTWRNPDPVIRW